MFCFVLLWLVTKRALIKTLDRYPNDASRGYCSWGGDVLYSSRKWINQEVQTPASRQEHWVCGSMGIGEAKIQEEKIKVKQKEECQRIFEVAYFVQLLRSQWNNVHKKCFLQFYTGQII